MATSLEEGTDFDFQYRFRRPDGGEGWMRVARPRPSSTRTGSPTRLLGVAVDITDRHLAEEHQTKLEHQLRQAHKLEAVGRLAGGIAHDFNNILLAIRGNGELALDALKDGEDAIEEVEEMVAAAERAAALTTQLLAFSRRQVLQAEVLDLNDVVRDMDKLLRRMIGEDVELHAVVGDEPVHVSADRSQIEQVIANLAVNARDAMPDGGLLTLEVATTEVGSERWRSTFDPGRYAKLTVSDTGRRDGCRDRRQDLRAVLHHEGRGNRVRALDRPRHRRAERRLDLGVQRGRPRHDLQGLSPAGRAGTASRIETARTNG